MPANRSRSKTDPTVEVFLQDLGIGSPSLEEGNRTSSSSSYRRLREQLIAMADSCLIEFPYSAENNGFSLVVMQQGLNLLLETYFNKDDALELCHEILASMLERIRSEKITNQDQAIRFCLGKIYHQIRRRRIQRSDLNVGTSDGKRAALAIALNDFNYAERAIPPGERIQEALNDCSGLQRLVFERYFIEREPQEKISIDLGLSPAQFQALKKSAKRIVVDRLRRNSQMRYQKSAGM